MQIKQQLREAQARLQTEAQDIVRRFWDLALEVKRTRPYSEWNKYGVRVRPRTVSISVEWFENVMTGPKGNRKHRAFYVSRGAGNKYPMSKFTKAPAWERQAIAEFEEAAAPIRQKADILVRIAKLAQKYASLHTASIPSQKDDHTVFADQKRQL